jgi:hypothetical protein
LIHWPTQNRKESKWQEDSNLNVLDHEQNYILQTF